MRQKKLICACLSILAACGVPALAQSPWTQERGGGFAQLSYYAIGPYDSLFRADGNDSRTSREITETTIEAYGEFGLTDRVTLIGVLPYRSPDSGDLVPEPTLEPTIPSASLSDPGNFRVGARYKAIDKKVALSVQLDLELPTGTQDEVSGLSTGYAAVTIAPTVSVGRGWRRAYVFGFLGLGYRTNDFSSVGVAGAEAGIRFFGRLWVVGLLSIVESFRNGDVVLPQSNLETGLFVNDQEYIAYGLKGLVEITDRVGIQLTYYTASSGNNVPRSPLFGAGVYFKW